MTTECMTTETESFILVAGSKGGVGKSLAAMATIDYLRARGKKVFLFESDTSNPDVLKPISEDVPHELVDLDQHDGWIEMVNRVGELKDHVCVLNSGSRNITAVRKYSSLLDGALAEIGIQLSTIWLINGQRDSLELLHQYRAALPNGRIHVLRNEHCANSFALYDKSEIRKMVESTGGQTHDFPALASRVTAQLYNERLTLEAAATSTKSPLGNRIETQRWRKQVGPLFDVVFG